MFFVVMTHHCDCGKWRCMTKCVCKIFQFDTKLTAEGFIELERDEDLDYEYQLVEGLSDAQEHFRGPDKKAKVEAE